MSEWGGRVSRAGHRGHVAALWKDRGGSRRGRGWRPSAGGPLLAVVASAAEPGGAGGQEVGSRREAGGFPHPSTHSCGAVPSPPGQRAMHGDESWVVPEARRWRPGERQAWHRASLGLRAPWAEELDSGRQPLPFHVPLLTGHLICPPNADPSPAMHLCLYFYKLFITGSSTIYQGRESSTENPRSPAP